MKKYLKFLLVGLIVVILIGGLSYLYFRPHDYTEVPAKVVKVHSDEFVSAGYVIFELENGQRINSKDSFIDAYEFPEENYLVGDNVTLLYDTINKYWTIKR